MRLYYLKTCILIDNIVNKYNNTCHSKIKMKPVDVTCTLNLVKK